jgi:1,2-diacylglycerol 3-alpha-glucosyltransferase
MKIGFFTDSYLPRLDGIAVSVDVFRRALTDLGHEVFVICPDRPGAKPQDDHVIYVPSVPSIFYEGYRDSIVLNPLLTKKLLHLDLDVVHIHTPTQIGLLGAFIARRCSLPTVSTCHSDERLLEHYGWLKHLFVGLNISMRTVLGKKKSSGTTMSSQFYNLFDAVVAPSEKVARYLRSGGCTKVNVVPTGVEDYFFVDKLVRKDKKIHFVSTSRLVIEKRVHATVEAFTALDTSSAKLTVVADGPELETIKELARKSKMSIEFTGRVSRAKMRDMLRSSDVLVSACQAETQGLVFNEAAAIGVPSIYSDDAINPVLVDGRSAIRTDGSVAQLSRAMQQYISSPDLIAKYGKEAKALAQDMTAEKQAEKLVAVYESVISS